MCDVRPQRLLAPFASASDMLELIERIDDPTFGLCLDTGHAHIMSQNIPEMIYAFEKHLRTVHLNDNFGMIAPVHPDQHLFPGAGTIDFVAVFNALKSISFTGAISLEPGQVLSKLPINARDASIMGGAMVAKAFMKEHWYDG